MKIFEKILAIAIVISLILKFSLIPGGDILTLWTTLILACIYYPFGFLFFNEIRLRHIFKKAAYKNVTVKKIIFGVLTGLGLSIICVGTIFKFLLLTGGDQMLLLGLIITSIVLIISLTLFLKNKDTNSKFILMRSSIMGGVGVILILTTELSIVKLQYRNHPDYINSYAKYLSDPKNEELRKKREMEYYRITLTEEEFKKYEKSTNK